MDKLRARCFKALTKLPPLSPGAAQLLAKLARRDVEARDLAAIVERDPLLTPRVLGLANSAAFGRRNTIVSVKHAIPLLGPATIRRHVLMWTIGRLFHHLPYDTSSTWSMTRFVSHSEATATLADLLAGHVRPNHGDAAFVAGLVHDIGKVVIASVDREAVDSAYDLQRLSNDTITACEREILGTDHAELSSRAAAIWNLPAELQHAVAIHHNTLPLDEPQVSLASVLQKADLFVNSIGLSVTLPHYQRPVPLEWPGHEDSLSLALRAFEREVLQPSSTDSQRRRNVDDLDTAPCETCSTT